jgi:hypothetical protein
MPIALLFIALVLIVAAWRNTQGTLGTALTTDIPGFATWFGALAVIGGLGYVPGLKTGSRALMALVLTVLVLTSYKQIFKGFSDAFQTASITPAVADPATQVAANPANPGIQSADITGTQAAAAAQPGPSNPALAWLQQYAPTAATDLALAGFGAVA